MKSSWIGAAIDVDGQQHAIRVKPLEPAQRDQVASQIAWFALHGRRNGDEASEFLIEMLRTSTRCTEDERDPLTRWDGRDDVYEQLLRHVVSLNELAPDIQRAIDAYSSPRPQ